MTPRVEVWQARSNAAESQMNEWGDRRVEAIKAGLEIAAMVAGEYEARARRDYFDAQAHIQKARKGEV